MFHRHWRLPIKMKTQSPAPSAGAAIHAAWLRHLRRKPGRPRLLFRSTMLLALAALAVPLVVQQQETRQIALHLAREQAGVQNVITNVARSAVFIQGSYGFRHEQSDRPLRVVLGPDGDPARLPDGKTMMSLTGEGPAVEITYTGTRFVDALSKRADLDLLGVTRELAKAGLATPLASRGIVGQVTAEAIVYDAQTTQGGSGGPAMNLDSEVVAVNAAILPGSGGSNIGIPITRATPLLDDTRAGK